MEKWNEWTKKQKVSLGAALAILVVGGAVGTSAYADMQHKKEVEVARKELTTDISNLNELADIVSKLRDPKNPSYLMSDLTLNEIDLIDSKIEKIKQSKATYDLVEVKSENTKVNNLYTDIKDQTEVTLFQFELQSDVNALFKTDKDIAINGSKINKELSITDDLTIKEIETLVEKTKNKNMLTLIPTSTEEDSSWENSVNELIQVATKQVEVINAVSKKVESFYKDQKPVNSTSLKDIEAVEKEAKAIKNEKAKKALLEKIKVVKESVTKKLKADAEAKAKADGGKVVENADGSYAVEQAEVPVTQTPSTTTNNDNYYGEDYSGTTNEYVAPSQNNNNWSAPSGGNSSNGNSYTPPATDGGSSSGGGSTTPPVTNDSSGTGEVIVEENINGGENIYEGW